ncbi:MAG: lytic transglycosylase domain-containing protein [Chromatiales bacterium]|jgi:soluble lytic murein transglycosylase-like protein
MDLARLVLVFLLLFLVPAASAGIAYQYRAPDGSLVYTDKELELPFVLVRKMHLTWGDVKGREIEKRIPVEKKPDVEAKEYNRPKFAGIVDKKAQKYNVTPELIHAVIEAESAYDPNAISSAGAVGLMQLMPATARRFGVTDRTDPEQNIDAGVNYLRELLNLFDNDVKLAIASYNAGEGAVMKYGRTIPPYRETQQYVVRVLKYLRRNLRESRQTFNTASSVPG